MQHLGDLPSAAECQAPPWICQDIRSMSPYSSKNHPFLPANRFRGMRIALPSALLRRYHPPVHMTFPILRNPAPIAHAFRHGGGFVQAGHGDQPLKKPSATTVESLVEYSLRP